MGKPNANRTPEASRNSQQYVHWCRRLQEKAIPIQSRNQNVSRRLKLGGEYLKVDNSASHFFIDHKTYNKLKPCNTNLMGQNMNLNISLSHIDKKKSRTVKKNSLVTKKKKLSELPFKKIL